MQDRPRVFLKGEPVAELTNLLFSKTSLHDYENLCSLDCLDIEENYVKPV